jgi:hypothetical protein
MGIIFGTKQVLKLQASESDHIILEGFKELERVARCGLTIVEIGATR